MCHLGKNDVARAERVVANIGPTRTGVLVRVATNEAELYNEEQDFLVNKGLHSLQSCVAREATQVPQADTLTPAKKVSASATQPVLVTT